ncbi:MAG TPA: SCO1664 family protein [Actinomycetota bacterium]|nr:SCO1664 family protein [Actinomycetota bacterium]
MSRVERPSPVGLIELLRTGEVEVLGLLPYASNYTFLASVGEDDRAVYKPTRGERPLWDFPPGTLAAREAAAYLVDVAGGFGIVPPTVMRGDLPLGPGSLQAFIEHDPELHFFTLSEARLADFEIFVAFDVVTNNADRKAGHVLQDANGKLWSVDHGLTFNVDDKLRTVIWEFADQPISEDVASRLERLIDAFDEDPNFKEQLGALLSETEIATTAARAKVLLRAGRYPQPGGLRPYPWPLV